MTEDERAVLTGVLLRMRAEASSPETSEANRPGLHAAVRVLQGLIRGDEDPAPAPANSHRVHLEVEADFRGSYFTAGELVDALTDWIDAALDDREDLDTVRMQGVVRTRAEGS